MDSETRNRAVQNGIGVWDPDLSHHLAQIAQYLDSYVNNS